MLKFLKKTLNRLVELRQAEANAHIARWRADGTLPLSKK